MNGTQSQNTTEARMKVLGNVLLIAFAMQSAGRLDVLYAHHVLVLQFQAVNDLFSVARTRDGEGVAVGVQSKLPWMIGVSSGMAKDHLAGAFCDSMRARITCARASFVGGV